MDATSSGFAGRLAAWGSVAVAVIVLLGGIVSMTRQVAEVNAKLDRNCRILVQLDQDLRLHVLSDGRFSGGHNSLRVFPAASC